MYFTGSASDTTPTGGDPTEGEIHPPDFCQIDPDEAFAGFNHVCSGAARGGLQFDYYGDPDVPVDKYLGCFTKPDPQPEGYRFTCSLLAIDSAFSAEVEQLGGHMIDACCLRDSPEAAVIPFCRIDAAEEFCRAASEQLNGFRKQLPVVNSLDEVNLQLENLNKFLATAETQTDCAITYATGLGDAGDFEDELLVWWNVEDRLDPEVGWPWFRNILTGLDTFKIDGFKNSGTPCSQIDNDALEGGQLTGGALELTSTLGSATVDVVGGSFSFRRTDCRLDSCPFRLETLAIEFEDFAIGPLRFSDVSASLATPADGLIHEDTIGLPEHRMHLVARFRLTVGGRPAFDGAMLSVGFTNNGTTEARLAPGPLFSVQRLAAVNWPFEMTLSTDLAPCD